MVPNGLLSLAFSLSFLPDALNMLHAAHVPVHLLRVYSRRIRRLKQEIIRQLVEVYVFALIMYHFCEAFEVILQLELSLAVVQSLVL